MTKEILKGNNAMLQDKKGISIHEISNDWGISVRTIWRWVSSGKFPRPDLAVGRIRRWKPETIQEWVEANNQ